MAGSGGFGIVPGGHSHHKIGWHPYFNIRLQRLMRQENECLGILTYMLCLGSNTLALTQVSWARTSHMVTPNVSEVRKWSPPCIQK